VTGCVARGRGEGRAVEGQAAVALDGGVDCAVDTSRLVHTADTVSVREGD